MKKILFFFEILILLLISFISCTAQVSSVTDGKNSAASDKIIAKNETSEKTEAASEDDDNVIVIKDYSKYRILPYYAGESVDAIYDIISNLINMERFRNHPVVIKIGEDYKEVIGLGIATSEFSQEGYHLQYGLFAKTSDNVYFIGIVAWLDSEMSFVFLPTEKLNLLGADFKNVYPLFIY